MKKTTTILSVDCYNIKTVKEQFGQINATLT